MTKRQYGLIATAAGAAIAARWWLRRRDSIVAGMSAAGRDHGQQIFSNSPRVS